MKRACFIPPNKNPQPFIFLSAEGVRRRRRRAVAAAAASAASEDKDDPSFPKVFRFMMPTFTTAVKQSLRQSWRNMH